LRRPRWHPATRRQRASRLGSSRTPCPPASEDTPRGAWPSPPSTERMSQDSLSRYGSTLLSCNKERIIQMAYFFLLLGRCLQAANFGEHVLGIRVNKGKRKAGAPHEDPGIWRAVEATSLLSRNHRSTCTFPNRASAGRGVRWRTSHHRLTSTTYCITRGRTMRQISLGATPRSAASSPTSLPGAVPPPHTFLSLTSRGPRPQIRRALQLSPLARVDDTKTSTLALAHPGSGQLRG
jgi:hypothetical protein